MNLRFRGNRALWIITIVMMGFSAVAMASASTVLGYRTGMLFAPWIKHMAMLLAALGTIYAVHRLDYSQLAIFVPRVLFWGAVGLLVLTLFFGVEINAARRWIRLPGVGIQLQSSDVARLVLVLYLAYQLGIKKHIDGNTSAVRKIQIVCTSLLSFLLQLIDGIIRGIKKVLRKTTDSRDSGVQLLYLIAAMIAFPLLATLIIGKVIVQGGLRGVRSNRFMRWNEVLIRFMLPIALIIGLILPTDLSTAILTAFTAFVLLFMAGFSITYLLGPGVMTAFVLLLFLWLGPKWGIERAVTWHNRIEAMVSGKPGYQATQAMIALYRGGITGTGPGGSTLRHFLPNSFSDYIYAIIVEEYGWYGMFAIWGIFLAFFIVGLRIANHAPGGFGRYLALGLTLHIVMQAVFHILVNVGIFPVTGLTLPLISMGGTSIIITGIAIGLIQSVAARATAHRQAVPPLPTNPSPHSQLTPHHA